MAVGTLVNEFLDEFPARTREGSGNRGPRETDVDIALAQLVDENQATGTPSRVLKFVDYNVEIDESGEASEVEKSTATKRASGRLASLRKRGYTVDSGWAIVGRNGALYAKYFGVGNVPAEMVRASNKSDADGSV